MGTWNKRYNRTHTHAHTHAYTHKNLRLDKYPIILLEIAYEKYGVFIIINILQLTEF